MERPACFPSDALWAEWRYLAMVARFQCTVCDDCTVDYARRMGPRCEKLHWQTVLFGRPSKVKAPGAVLQESRDAAL